MQDKKDTTKNTNKKLDDILMSLHDGPAVGEEENDGDSRKKLTPSERVSMIEQAFQDILGRKPDTRDLNYYKYSSLGEQAIRNELINGKEHRELITNGREFRKIKSMLDATKTRVKVLEAEIKDQEQSTRELNLLLKEKNTHIQELREKLKNPLEHKCYNPIIEKKEGGEIVANEERETPFSRFFERFLSIFSSE